MFVNEDVEHRSHLTVDLAFHALTVDEVAPETAIREIGRTAGLGERWKIG